MESYIHYGVGPHTCLGKEASQIALTAMLMVVGRLDNLRRAPGPQGQLKKIPRPGGFYIYMRENEEGYFVFPMSEFPPLESGKSVNDCVAMKVHWDGELPQLKKS
jgi:linoleate 10R-lipoxygenase